MTKKQIEEAILTNINYSDSWERFLTEEHIAIIQKGIAKALKRLDYTEIMTNFLKNEFDGIYSNCYADESLTGVVVEALRTHFINCKVIKPIKEE